MITSSPLKRTKSHVYVAQRAAEEPSTKSVLFLIHDSPINCSGPQATFLRAHNNVGSVCDRASTQTLRFSPESLGSQHCRNTSTPAIVLFSFVLQTRPLSNFAPPVAAVCCFWHALCFDLQLFTNWKHTYSSHFCTTTTLKCWALFQGQF